MSYQALARKWRPKNFAEVLDQAHVVSALCNGLDSQRVHHAFLFAGTRGVGKTTLARIFAKALNCENGVSSTPCGKCVPCRGVEQGNFIDLIEVDAASRTKVDDTRELLDNVQYTPTQGRFKIYLIDEVHMLSTHSFNALLKTLEEPPAHVKFLLATTDPQKLPTTVLSRCIQFNLKAMDIACLTELLEKILKAEKIKYEPAALLIIARAANGSARDALSLLDQGIAFGNGKVHTTQIRTMLGMLDDQLIYELLKQIYHAESAEALQTVAKMATRAVDFGNVLDEILTMLHNVALYQVSKQAVEWKGVDSASLGELAKPIDAELLQLIYQIALIGKRDLSLAPDPRSGFEMIVLRMISFRPEARQVTPNAPRATPVAAKTIADSAATKGKGTASAASRQSATAKEANPTNKSTASQDKPNASQADTTTKVTENTASSATFEQLLAGDASWTDYLAQSGLVALEREMMMHTLFVSVADNTLHLSLGHEHSYLLDTERVQKIEQHLSKKCTHKIKLQITSEENAKNKEATPFQKQKQDKQKKQQSVEQSFTEDSKVQELIDLFDAEVVSDSIHPSTD